MLRPKKEKEIFSEFELQAKAQKCDYVISYCKESEAKFIRTLPRYELRCWNKLKNGLFSYYPAEQEDRVYRLEDLRNRKKIFRGLKPELHVKHELEAQKLWTDLTRPPVMNRVSWKRR